MDPNRAGISYREQAPMKEMVGLQDAMKELGNTFVQLCRKFKLPPQQVAHALVERFGGTRGAG